MNLISLVLIFLPVALANSDAEKWSWPSSSRDQRQADKRNDIYDDKANDNEKVGRIRVPTSFDNRRPLQPYQVKEPTNNRPKPLSDEFSNEFTASGESFNGNRPQQSVNTPNRVGAQQANDFGFGGGFPGAYPGAGGYQGGFPGQGFPGQGGYHQGGFPGQGGFHQGGGFPGQFGGAYPGQFGGNGGFGGQHNLANGVLVGPGGPTGIIGRPYGGYPPQFGHGGIYGGQHGGHGINPYGGGYNPAFGGAGGFPGPYFDQPDNKPQGKQNLQANKIEKSA